MTAYKRSIVVTTPYFVSEAKEKRKQQLQAVWQRRKIIYAEYMQKRQVAQQRDKHS